MNSQHRQSGRSPVPHKYETSCALYKRLPGNIVQSTGEFIASNYSRSMQKNVSYIFDIFDILVSANSRLRILQDKFLSCFSKNKKVSRHQVGHIIKEINSSMKTLLNVVEDLKEELRTQYSAENDTVNHLKLLINAFEIKLNNLVQNVKHFNGNKDPSHERFLNSCMENGPRMCSNQYKTGSNKVIPDTFSSCLTTMSESLPQNTNKVEKKVVCSTRKEPLSISMPSNKFNDKNSTRKKKNIVGHQLNMGTSFQPNVTGQVNNTHGRKHSFGYEKETTIRNNSHFTKPQSKVCWPIFKQYPSLTTCHNSNISVNSNSYNTEQYNPATKRRSKVRNNKIWNEKLENAEIGPTAREYTNGSTSKNKSTVVELNGRHPFKTNKNRDTFKGKNTNNVPSKPLLNTFNNNKQLRIRSGWDNHRKNVRGCNILACHSREHFHGRKKFEFRERSRSSTTRRTRKTNSKIRLLGKYRFKDNPEPNRVKKTRKYKRGLSTSSFGVRSSSIGSSSSNYYKERNYLRPSSSTRSLTDNKRDTSHLHKHISESSGYQSRYKNEVVYRERKPKYKFINTNNYKHYNETHKCTDYNSTRKKNPEYPLCNPNICYKNMVFNKPLSCYSTEDLRCNRYFERVATPENRKCRARVRHDQLYHDYLPYYGCNEYALADLVKSPCSVRKKNNQAFVCKCNHSVEDVESYYTMESDFEGSKSSLSTQNHQCSSDVYPYKPKYLRNNKSVKHIYAKKKSKSQKRSYSFTKVGKFVKESHEEIVEYDVLPENKISHLSRPHHDRFQKEFKNTSTGRLITIIQAIRTKNKKVQTKKQKSVDSETDPLPRVRQESKYTNTVTLGKRETGTDPHPTKEVRKTNAATDPIHFGKIAKQTSTERVFTQHRHTETDHKRIEVKDKETSYDRVVRVERGIDAIPTQVEDKSMQFDTIVHKPELKHAKTSVESIQTSNKIIQTSFIDAVKKPAQDEKQTQTVKTETQSKGISPDKLLLTDQKVETDHKQTFSRGVNPEIMKGHEKEIQTTKIETFSRGVDPEKYEVHEKEVQTAKTSTVSRGFNPNKTQLSDKYVQVSQDEHTPSLARKRKENHSSNESNVDYFRETDYPAHVSQLSMHLVFEKCHEDIYKCKNNCKQKTVNHENDFLNQQTTELKKISQNIDGKKYYKEEKVNNNESKKRIQCGKDRNRIKVKNDHDFAMKYSKRGSNGIKQDRSIDETLVYDSDYLSHSSFWQNIANKVKHDDLSE